MQSFLQYKRFRTTVQAQLDRDRERVRGPNSNGPAQEHSPSSIPSDDSKQDLEKGDDPVAENGIPPESGLQDWQTGQPQQSQEPSQESVEELKHPEEEEDGHDEEEDDDDDHELAAATRTLSRVTTQQSGRTALGNVLTGVEVRKRSTREGGEGNVFVVGWQGEDDPSDPHNWSYTKRISYTAIIAGIGCVVGFASAIDSSALLQASADFGVSEVVESLATGLFLVGFGLGALYAAPFSETVGRNPVYIVTLVLYMIFVMASALAPNIGAQLAFRFLAGLFGSTPLTCAGGSVSDLWSPLERVFAFPIFANAAFTGPLLGPIVGGWIAQSTSITWRWVDWVTLIFSGAILALVVLFLPETYPPTLLKWKAEHLRAITGDERYRAAIEIRQESLITRLKRSLYRPFLLTAREPIIILLAFYLTIIYIILFTFLNGYTYIFDDNYNLSQGIGGVCFAGIVVGLFLASILVPFIYKWAKRDLAKIQEEGGTRLPPEFRLWYAMLGGSFAIPISLFWMGWTARPSISIWSPLLASVLFGYGILCIFITCYQYIIDAYESFAASALVSITVIRYVVSGGMVVVGVPWYQNLGPAYTLTILACISVPLVPVPFVFYKYGPWIRSKSKYAIKV